MKWKQTKRRPERWTAWARSLASRFERYAFPWSACLVLHAHCSHTASLVAERWLASLTFPWQLHLSLLEYTHARASQTLAKQIGFLIYARTAMQPAARSQLILAQSKVFSSTIAQQTHSFVRTSDSRWRTQTRLERRFLERRDSTARLARERLIQRSERIERREIGAQKLALRREVISVTKASDNSPSSEARPPQSQRSVFQAIPGPTSIPQINVNHLADQVIAQIDRRIIARRERMGRI